MRWRDQRRSSNVEDGRGVGGGGGGGFGGGKLGLGGVAAVVVISLLLGKNPLEMLGLVSQMTGGGTPTEQSGGGAPPESDEQAQFIEAILGSTEDVWGGIFRGSKLTYEQPVLHLFRGSVGTACGGATSASGPFYCPGDHKVYIDLEFFQEMKARLGGGGEFADAYVVAHEVGHHVQTLLGVADTVSKMRGQGMPMEGDNGLSVRQELQADCYAGVWGNAAQAQNKWLEEGEVEQALSTATAIGDDRLQKQSQGTVVPDSFTHGTSAQRVRWFKIGFEKGDANLCDTFAAKNL